MKLAAGFPCLIALLGVSGGQGALAAAGEQSFPTPAYVDVEWAALVRVADANGDGMVTKEEVEAVPWRLVGRTRRAARAIDTDSDLVVTKTEYLAISGADAEPPDDQEEPFKAWQGLLDSDDNEPDEAQTEPLEVWAQLLELADTDGNGQLSAEELNAFPLELVFNVSSQFARLDGDGDDVLSKEEYRVFAVSQERSLEERFRRADQDGSGGLSPAEVRAAIGNWASYAARYFEAIDANGNGELTWQERIQFVASPASLQPPPTPKSAQSAVETPSEGQEQDGSDSPAATLPITESEAPRQGGGSDAGVER